MSAKANKIKNVTLKQSSVNDTTEHEFNPKTDYSVVLVVFQKHFTTHWNEKHVSPETGLEGFDELTVLGAGSFGQVKLVKEQQTGEYFAAKLMLKDKIVKLKQVSHVFNEKRVLYSVKFPNLLTLHFSRKNNDYLILGLPFIVGGELFTYHRKMRKFTETQARFYCAQVFLALEYMHYMKLLYRDLKPENILIDSRGYVKITDFGFAKYVESRTMTLCGTPEYLAPEIILSKPYGGSVDWWSFGILVYELVAGQSPFALHNRNVMVMYGKIVDGRFKMPPSFTAPLKDLVTNLLQVDLSRRYGNLSNGNKDIKSHEWFKSINWYSVLNQEMPAPYVPYVKNAEDVSNFDKYPDLKTIQESKECHFAELFKEF